MHGTPSASSFGKNNSCTKFLIDFMFGGRPVLFAKTVATPIKRVKLLLQTQYTNHKLAARPYTGMNCMNGRHN
jgi:hypothetical protein